MRLKAAAIIMAIVIAATVVNYVSSLNFTTNKLDITMARDQSLVRDIADSYVSTHIDLLENNASEVASSLLRAASADEWPELMRSGLDDYPEFMAFSVFSREGPVTSFGNSPSENYSNREDFYLARAFGGIKSVSTTFKDPYTGELVFYIYVPMGPDKVLAGTFSGMYFSDLLSEYRLWETGTIYIIDDEGTLIAHYEQDRVEARINYIELGKTDQEMTATGAFFERMLSEPAGTGTYPMHGKERLCSFKHISNTSVDWVIAVIAPLDESPRASVRQGLLVSALIFIVAALLIAFFLSGVVVKPFARIEAQNAALEELNKTVSEQSGRLQDEHERTKLLLDGTPLACSLWNAEYEMFLCNDECVRLFEVKDKQEFMDLFFDVLTPEFQPDGSRSDEKIVELIDQVFSEGSFATEWMHQTKYKEPLPVEVTLVPVLYEGRDTIAGYVRDLREYKEMMAKIEDRDEQLKEALADAREANEAKSDFLAKMSHEMRTPLNAIIGLSMLTLEDETLGGESRLNITKVSNAGDVLLNTVNDILDISKIEAGKYELDPNEYDTSSLINDVASQCSVYLGDKPITFDLKVDGSLPKQLFGDELRIKQIINNLLSNAFKYTKEGTVAFDVSCSRYEDKVLLKVNVSDTGIGIKAKDVSYLFEDYSQVDQQKNRGVIGTGLGLPIAKKLLDMMDGTIEVESEYGKGSLFSVTIPQRPVSEETIGDDAAKNLMSFKYMEEKRQSDAKISRVSLPYARVLVVDDFVTNLDVARGLMKPYGMTIDCLTKGQQAVDAIREEDVHYDAVFMDQMMPEMNGTEAVRLIRDIGTDYAKNIPIIALTANAIVGSEKYFLENGFQAFISKPIEVRRLDSVIREFVRNKEKEKEYFEELKKSSAGSAADAMEVERRAKDDRRSGIERRALYMGIAGIDMEKGVERFSGDSDAYFEVLRSFAVNTPQLLEGIKSVNEKNLSDYAIIVHGIKGSCRGICADDIGNIAETLELAAKGEDVGYVVKNNPLFLTAAWKLLADIDGFFEEENPKTVKPRQAKPGAEALGALLEACKDYDMDAADRAISELEKYEYDEDGELVAWLWENIQQMNFTEIIDKLTALE